MIFMFLFNRKPVLYFQYYKYLGCTSNEVLAFIFRAQVQDDSAGNAIRQMNTNMIKNHSMCISWYANNFTSCGSVSELIWLRPKYQKQ